MRVTLDGDGNVRFVPASGRRIAGRRPDVLDAVPTYIAVDAYLDTDDDATAADVLRALDRFAELLGYEGPIEERIERGSIWRRAQGVLKNGLTSGEVPLRLGKPERALQLVRIP